MMTRVCQPSISGIRSKHQVVSSTTFSIIHQDEEQHDERTTPTTMTNLSLDTVVQLHYATAD
eukprot:scaffold3680_cov65-Cylindrotheca_fusiformis.AAC.2